MAGKFAIAAAVLAAVVVCVCCVRAGSAADRRMEEMWGKGR